LSEKEVTETIDNRAVWLQIASRTLPILWANYPIDFRENTPY